MTSSEKETLLNKLIHSFPPVFIDGWQQTQTALFLISSRFLHFLPSPSVCKYRKSSFIHLKLLNPCKNEKFRFVKKTNKTIALAPFDRFFFEKSVFFIEKFLDEMEESVGDFLWIGCRPHVLDEFATLSTVGGGQRTLARGRTDAARVRTDHRGKVLAEFLKCKTRMCRDLGIQKKEELC